MNRRGFLKSIGIAVGAGLILPDVARELLTPERSIFLPPLGGWRVENGNRILTIDQITREALRVLHLNLQFVKGINEFDASYGISRGGLRLKLVTPQNM